jgi:hypothetical protein
VDDGSNIAELLFRSSWLPAVLTKDEPFDNKGRDRARLDFGKAFRRGTCISTILVLSVAPASKASASDSQTYDSLTMSGTATEALAQAFSVFPAADSTPLKAPFILNDYTVQILQEHDEISVAFYPNVKAPPLVVHVRDGKISSHDEVPPTPDVPPLLIPGVIAGEIIAVYWHAREEDDVVVKAGGTTFSTSVDVLAGGPLIGFVPYEPPAYFRTHTCVTGNCNGRSVFRITLGQNSVTIVRRTIS